jgi:2-polyprenyl-3-methyl-5-hydroxy-6-metoxy-1,4-benzoquinol methylase
MVRRRGVPSDLALNVAALDDALRAVVPETDEEEREQLEADVNLLHALWDISELDLAASPRRLTGPLLTRFRRLAQGSTPLLIQRLAEYNAANARAVSALRNQAIRQDTIIERIRDGVAHVLQPAVERQVEGLLELERVVRRLETEVARLRRPELEIDQGSLVERFRGSERTITERQQPYARHFRGRDNVLDIGCGRGEFLEILAREGIGARGVDIDPAMVERCLEKGLNVERRDALVELEGSEPATLDGVFAAQLIEHLDAPSVVRLVRSAFAALRPGGVLLVESPNPRSLVALAAFYVDLTHVRPYDAETIRWLVEETGFEHVELEYTLEPEEGSDGDENLQPLNARVFGPQAYAVVGTKPGE